MVVVSGWDGDGRSAHWPRMRTEAWCALACAASEYPTVKQNETMRNTKKMLRSIDARPEIRPVASDMFLCQRPAGLWRRAPVTVSHGSMAMLNRNCKIHMVLTNLRWNCKILWSCDNSELELWNSDGAVALRSRPSARPSVVGVPFF